MSTGNTPCPSCAAPTTEGQRFCGSCGVSLAPTCSACGSENPPDFKFCGTCGAAIQAEAPEQPPTEERRWATVVFADLSGFTSLSERTDPEDVHALVDRCMDKLAAVAEQFEGAVDSVSGDQIMVVFGAPIAHEDDPDRAVRCALEMVSCAEQNAEEFGGLPLRIGVNSGEMMFAPVGPQGARQHTIMGDAVNVGARLQSAAPRSGVLVGDATYQASRHAIAYDGPIEVQAKGKEDLVTAWRATGVIAAPSERPVSAAAPMVGRDAVLGQLHSLWKRVAADRRPHLVTVLGHPGIGKTRLSQELAIVIHEQGGRVVRGRSQAYGELLGYGAFAQQVKSLAGIRDTDPAEEALARLSAFVHELGTPDAGDITDQLAVLVGLADHMVADRQVLFYAARRIIETLAAQQPVLLVFEDIHWADQSLLDLITSLAGRVREAPVMLLTLARPELLERASSWGGGLDSYTALPLAPLTEAEAIALVSELTPGLDEAVSRQVAETAAGNPLFIEELAASLSEGRVGADLPTSVKALIASRLDALPAEERRLLLDASVLGKVFWRGALERIAGAQVHVALDALEARDLIRREHVSRIEGDDEYTFKHILIREVAYATLPRAARRDRHRDVALFLEEATGERTAESATMLAHHWREAGDTERALEYLMTASESASRAWAKDEALRLATQAVDLLAEDDPRRLALRTQRAGLLVEGGHHAEAVAELDDIIPQTQGRARLEAMLLRGRAAYWLVDTETLFRVAGESEALAIELDDAEMRSAALALSLEAEAMEGHLREVVEIGGRALAEWPSDRRAELRTIVRGLVGLSQYWLGDHDEAMKTNTQAYNEGVELHSIEATLVSGAQVGMSLSAQSRHEEAFAFYEQLVARGREIELVPRLTSRALIAWGGALAEIGEFDAATALNEEGIELATRAKFANGQSQGRLDLVFWQIARGDIGAGEVEIPGLFEEAAKLKGWHEWLIAGRLAAAHSEILLARGRVDEAVEAARDSIRRSAEVGRAKYVARSGVTLGRALQRLGRASEAVAATHAALSAAEQIAHARSIWIAATALADLLAAVGDDDGAEAASKRARSAFEQFVAGLSPERRARLSLDVASPTG